MELPAFEKILKVNDEGVGGLGPTDQSPPNMVKDYLRYMLPVTVLCYCFYYEYNNWLMDDKANHCRLLINMKKVLAYAKVARGFSFTAL